MRTLLCVKPQGRFRLDVLVVLVRPFAPAFSEALRRRLHSFVPPLRFERLDDGRGPLRMEPQRRPVVSLEDKIPNWQADVLLRHPILLQFGVPLVIVAARPRGAGTRHDTATAAMVTLHCDPEGLRVELRDQLLPFPLPHFGWIEAAPLPPDPKHIRN